MNKFYMFELILGECKQDPDRVLKIQIYRPDPQTCIKVDNKVSYG